MTELSKHSRCYSIILFPSRSHDFPTGVYVCNLVSVLVAAGDGLQERVKHKIIHWAMTIFPQTLSEIHPNFERNPANGQRDRQMDRETEEQTNDENQTSLTEVTYTQKLTNT